MEPRGALTSIDYNGLEILVNMILLLFTWHIAIPLYINPVQAIIHTLR